MYFPKSLTIPLIVCSHIGVPSSLLPSKLDNCGSFSALNIPTESLSTEHLPPECHHFKYLHVKLSHRDMLLHDTGTSNLRLSVKFAFFQLGFGVVGLSVKHTVLYLDRTLLCVSVRPLTAKSSRWRLLFFLFDSSCDMNSAHLSLLTAPWSLHIYICVCGWWHDVMNECLFLYVTQCLGFDVTEWFNLMPNDWTITALSPLLGLCLFSSIAVCQHLSFLCQRPVLSCCGYFASGRDTVESKAAFTSRFWDVPAAWLQEAAFMKNCDRGEVFLWFFRSACTDPNSRCK